MQATCMTFQSVREQIPRPNRPAFLLPKLQTLPALLLVLLLYAVALPGFAVTLSDAIVIDDTATGRTTADERSPEVHRFPRYTRVKVVESASAPDGATVFRLEQMISQHRNPRPPERIPSLWVDASHLVLFDDMKPPANCWPYRQATFRNGAQAVKIEFNADGSGTLMQTEGDTAPVAVRVLESRGVIGIRNRKGTQLYTLFSDWETGELLLPEERVTTEKRDCNAAAAK